MFTARATDARFAHLTTVVILLAATLVGVITPLFIG